MLAIEFSTLLESKVGHLKLKYRLCYKQKHQASLWKKNKFQTSLLPTSLSMLLRKLATQCA